MTLIEFLSKNKISFTVLICLFSIQVLFGQTDIIWSKTFGTEFSDEANDIQITADGGYIALGESLTEFNDMGIPGPGNVYVLKLDKSGDLEWERMFGGTGVERAYVIQQTFDGGYIISGESNSEDGDVSTNYGDLDSWILKLSSNGDLEWEKVYGGSNYDGLQSIKQTEEGGYILAGASRSDDGNIGFNNGQADVWILKLDQEGNEEWQKIYGASKSEGAYSIQITTDGGYIVLAHKDPGSGPSDCWIIKLNISGEIEWQKTYGGTKSEYPKAIRQTNDGGYIFTSGTSSLDGDVSYNNGGVDYWVVKLNAEGEMMWEKTFGGTNWEIPHSIEQTLDDGYVIAGYSHSNDGDVVDNYGHQDGWILKLNSIGDMDWQHNFGGSNRDEIYAIKQDSDGSFIVAGKTLSSDFDIAPDSTLTSYELWVFKIGDEAVSAFENPLPKLTITPNPSMGPVTVSLNDQTILFDVHVVDLKGRIIFVKTQHNGDLQIEHLISGTYVIKVNVKGNNYTRKVIIH